MPLGWLLDYGSVTLLANQKSTLSRLVESICMSVSTVDATKKCTQTGFVVRDRSLYTLQLTAIKCRCRRMSPLWLNGCNRPEVRQLFRLAGHKFPSIYLVQLCWLLTNSRPSHANQLQCSWGTSPARRRNLWAINRKWPERDAAVLSMESSKCQAFWGAFKSTMQILSWHFKCTFFT